MWCSCFYVFFTFYKWRGSVPQLSIYFPILLFLCCYSYTNSSPSSAPEIQHPRVWLLLSVASFLLSLSPPHLPSNSQHSRHIQCRPQGPVIRNLLPKLTRPLSRA